MTPFFSVVVPVYNRANTLKRALRSVLAQTCQDFEVIVIDDGSRDNPKAVVDAIGDPRIRIFHQENKGGAAARNHGFDEAQGNFVALLDSDDRFLPHHLENMRRLLEGSSGIAGYSRVVVDRGQGVTMTKPPRAIRSGEDMATYLMCDRGIVPTITLVVERKIAQRVRYSEGWRFAEDTDFAIRLFKAGQQFRMIEEPSSVWEDTPDPGRTSAGRKGARLIPWLEQIRSQIPEKAYYGCRGWTIAKGIAATNPLRALQYYLTALFHGCYRPRLAAIIFLQIFLSDSLYRRIADRAIPFVPRIGTSAS